MKGHILLSATTMGGKQNIATGRDATLAARSSMSADLKNNGGLEAKNDENEKIGNGKPTDTPRSR